MNLNAPFNPLGWSAVIKALPLATGGQIAGFNYLGLGMIFLFAIAIFFRIKVVPKIFQELLIDSQSDREAFDLTVVNQSDGQIAGYQKIF
jgi:hypothetical protein